MLDGKIFTKFLIVMHYRKNIFKKILYMLSPESFRNMSLSNTQVAQVSWSKYEQLVVMIYFRSDNCLFKKHMTLHSILSITHYTLISAVVTTA